MQFSKPVAVIAQLALAASLGAGLGSAGPAHGRSGADDAGGPAIATESAVFVERVDDQNGRRLEPASLLTRGDRVVTIVTWHRTGNGTATSTGRSAPGNGGFVLTNPLPGRLAYQRSASDIQDVSVDGGRTWGALDTLRTNGHPATPEDVTHVRWRIPAHQAALGQGRIAYAGVVR